MPKFNLELLVGDELSKKEITFRLNRFIARMPSERDNFMNVLFNDIVATKHWHMLGMVDGYPKQSYFHELSEEKHWNKEKAHKWSRKHFSKEQLQELFTLAVNCAIIPYRIIGAPGYEIGHSIVYKQVNRPESMFYTAIDEYFLKRLNNGRFWENLHNLGANVLSDAIPTVNDVLENNYEEIDLFFAKKGLQIFYRNAGSCTEFRIEKLSRKAIDNYGKFLTELDKNLDILNISEREFYPLFRAYYAVLKEKDQDYNPIVQDYEERLKSPLIKKYINKKYKKLAEFFF